MATITGGLKGIPLFQADTDAEVRNIIGESQTVRRAEFFGLTPPDTPGLGMLYVILGPGAVGDWTGKGHRIATWTSLGWSYYPTDRELGTQDDGLSVWDKSGRREFIWDRGAWEPNGVAASRVVDANTLLTLGVPGQSANFTRFSDFELWLRERSINPGVNVTLKVLQSATAHDCSHLNRWRIDHLDGQRVKIRGETGGARPLVDIEPTSNGAIFALEIARDSGLGWVDNIWFVNEGQPTTIGEWTVANSTTVFGIGSFNGAGNVFIGENVQVTGCYVGIHGEGGGLYEVHESFETNNWGDCGVLIKSATEAKCNRISVWGGGHASKELGRAITCETGYVRAHGARVWDTQPYAGGFAVQLNGTMECRGALFGIDKAGNRATSRGTGFATLGVGLMDAKGSKAFGADISYQVVNGAMFVEGCIAVDPRGEPFKQERSGIMLFGPYTLEDSADLHGDALTQTTQIARTAAPGWAHPTYDLYKSQLGANNLLSTPLKPQTLFEYRTTAFTMGPVTVTPTSPRALAINQDFDQPWLNIDDTFIELGGDADGGPVVVEAQPGSRLHQLRLRVNLTLARSEILASGTATNSSLFLAAKGPTGQIMFNTGGFDRAWITPAGRFTVGRANPTADLEANIIRCGTYLRATLPSAVAHGKAAFVYCTDLTGGEELVVSDGTNWRRASDKTVQS
jgi:Protein of unknown function (DUF2793)